MEIKNTTVNRALSEMATSVQGIKDELKKIDDNYIQATATTGEWNSTAAADYIDSIARQLSDFASQFNTKIPQATERFVEGVNMVNTGETDLRVHMPNLTTLPSIERHWDAQDTDYKTTDSYASFTSTNFTTHMQFILNRLGECKSYMEQAQKEGMAGYFCNELLGEFTSLTDSATEVIEKYDSKAAENASTKEKNINHIKSAT